MVLVMMMVMPISAPITIVFFIPITVVFFVPITVVFFVPITVVVLCTVETHVRAAMVSPLGAPMTSAMRSDVDRRSGVVVLIVLSLRNTSEADDQGNRSGDWHRTSDIKAAVHLMHIPRECP